MCRESLNSAAACARSWRPRDPQ